MEESRAHDAYVGTVEAAALLGITRQAVLKRIRTGRLPARKVGRSYVVPLAAVVRRDGKTLLVQDPALRDIVERLVRGYDPERVYLFGSAARADADEGSDYDIMVVVADDAPPEKRRARFAYEGPLRGVTTPVDVMVMSRKCFDETAEFVVASLTATIAREGVLLYVA